MGKRSLIVQVYSYSRWPYRARYHAVIVTEDILFLLRGEEFHILRSSKGIFEQDGYPANECWSRL